MAGYFSFKEKKRVRFSQGLLFRDRLNGRSIGSEPVNEGSTPSP